MHLAGLELTKLTYPRLAANLIRHRGDRLTCNRVAHLKGVGSEPLKATPALLTRTSQRPYSCSISDTNRCQTSPGQRTQQEKQNQKWAVCVIHIF